VLPNLGFVVQLKAFEIDLFGEPSDVPLQLAKLFGTYEKPDE